MLGEAKKCRTIAKKRVARPPEAKCSNAMNRIPVALFPTRTQAEPVRQRLVQAGCAAEIQDELWVQKLWFVSKRAAGARLEVPADQAERADKLLLAWDLAEGVLRDAIRCPKCKSLRVDYPQFARNSLLTNVAAGLLAETGLVEKDYYCEHCQYTWPKAESHPAHVRAHMAPYYFIDDVRLSSSPAAKHGQPSSQAPKVG
jgi:predicted Zn-ribbon and HTH transcriptional regulator